MESTVEVDRWLVLTTATLLLASALLGWFVDPVPHYYPVAILGAGALGFFAAFVIAEEDVLAWLSAPLKLILFWVE